MRIKKFGFSLLAVAAACAAGLSMASSHREAPFITTSPKVDGTDFYMFRSYEGVTPTGTGGRSDYVTLIANYIPLQAPYGGPNYMRFMSTTTAMPTKTLRSSSALTISSTMLLCPLAQPAHKRT
jgi:hypothetical protein